jgi:hypothetical protein
MSRASVAQDHPDPTLTAAYLDGTLDAAATERLEGHLATCRECRQAVVDLHATLLLPEESVPSDLIARALDPGAERRRPGWRPTAVAAALAATVLIGAGIALWRRSGSAEGQGVYRGTHQGEFAALAPARDETVSSARVVFRWSPLPSADRYLVIVLDATGGIAATVEAIPPATSVTWSAPPSQRGGTMIWKVRALRGGRTITETSPLSFELR